MTGYESKAEVAMDYALAAAELVSAGDLPIGAAVIDLRTGKLVMSSSNAVFEENDLSAHAEMILLRKIGRVRALDCGGDWLLAVTLEPCPMCSWVIRNSGIRAVAFGARNELYGAGGSVFDFLREPRLGFAGIQVFPETKLAECRNLLGTKFVEIRGRLK